MRNNCALCECVIDDEISPVSLCDKCLGMADCCIGLVKLEESNTNIVGKRPRKKVVKKKTIKKNGKRRKTKKTKK